MDSAGMVLSMFSPLKKVDSMMDRNISTKNIHAAPEALISNPIPSNKPNNQPTQPVSVHLLQGALEDLLQQHLSVLRQDIQNVHMDIIKQFQLQHTEFKEIVREVDYKNKEQQKEIEILKAEIRRLKLKRGE